MSTSQEEDIVWFDRQEAEALAQIRRNYTMSRKRKYEDGPDWRSTRTRQGPRQLVPLSAPRIMVPLSAPGGGYTRRGYSSVARTRGAAVTGEMKYFDSALTLANVALATTTWVAGSNLDPTSTINLGSAAVATPLCLFAPIVGAALNNRIGRSVKMLKLRITGMIALANQSAQSTADPGAKVRVILAQDCQTNAAQMTGAQLMNDALAADTTIQTMQNPNNFGRFKVWKDKTFAVGDLNMATDAGTGTMVSQGKVYSFKWSLRFKEPIEVHFNATNGGTVADIIDHSFHVLALASQTSFTPQLSYYCRVCYKE